MTREAPNAIKELDSYGMGFNKSKNGLVD